MRHRYDTNMPRAPDSYSPLSWNGFFDDSIEQFEPGEQLNLISDQLFSPEVGRADRGTVDKSNVDAVPGQKDRGERACQPGADNDDICIR